MTHTVLLALCSKEDRDNVYGGVGCLHFHHCTQFFIFFCLQFVAASWKPPVCCTIMEYVPSGSLRAFLHKSETGPIPMQTIVCMALDVARGMEYLHSQGVVHRDLKSENLVLTEDLHVKLTDFGVGCLETECDARIDDTGTYRWMAPEMISHKHYSKKVDVYSFGVVLWELVTGQLPFEDMTPVQVAYAVVHKVCLGLYIRTFNWFVGVISTSKLLSLEL